MRMSSIAGRLYVLVVLGAVGLIALSVVGALRLQSILLDDRVALTQQMDDVALSAVKALYERSQKGELSEAAAMAEARQVLQNLRYGNNEYYFVYDVNGTNVVHGLQPERAGKNFYDLPDARGEKYIQTMIRVAQAGGGVLHYWAPRSGAAEPLRKVSYAQFFRPWGWVIGTGLYLDDIDKSFRALAIKMALAVLVVVILTTAVTLAIGRTISGGITVLRDNMRVMAAGNLDIAIGARERRDEIGEMAQDLESFRASLLQARQSELDQQRQQQQARQKRTEEMTAMADRFENISGVMAENVRGAAGGLLKTATVMGDLVIHSEDRTKTVGQASSDASTKVAAVAAATEQLAASIDEITALVRRSSRGAEEALEKARQSSRVIQGLADATLKINDVVQLITDIAAQTNLLALNATIEAARAGEAGKGFAVVANEVKTLASATARATGDITAQITSVQAESRTAALAIEDILGTIQTISETAGAVATAVEGQNSATRDIARNIQAAAGTTNLVSDNVEQMLEIAVKTGQSTKELVVSANIMSGMANELEEKVKEFGQFVRMQ